MRSKPELQATIREPGAGRAVLVVNARSRRGRRLLPEARRLMREAGLEFAEVHPVTDPTRLGALFERVLASSPDLVVVGGGDGTIAEAVSHLAHHDVALGVLPFGTTNNFARSLELPLDLPGAVRILAEGKVADVDVGWFQSTGDPQGEQGEDEHIFANMVSLGLSVQVAEHVPHGLKRVLGRPAYALTAARLLPRHQPFTATITVDGEEQTVTTHQLNIANGAHHSGQRIARDASPDDRLLAVYRLGDGRRLRLAGATLRHVLTGQWRSLSEDAFLTTGEVRVSTDPPLAVDVDGEIRGRTPVTIRLHGNALRVIVPESFLDT
ncbi:diacylglycerol/lipid kinase family protein [Actinomadura parmotrematis]|uniref:Diacylglycerol kinase n=1 Tax=Actinomadura parmotrematis TaxID=2864039 RepID=A0ABS7FY98_9ACTN|nr:diacylglycerol kinase family protein [Actinomadura parmotrematis]MBW8485402.1 diacylglycerol kinase [Actinomadura parmotrematis]